jgi:hypothetical protein
MNKFSTQTKPMSGQSRQPSIKPNARFSGAESKPAVDKATPKGADSKSFDDESQES